MDNFFKDNIWDNIPWDEDYHYDPFDEGMPTPENFDKINKEQEGFNKIADISDYVLKNIKNERSMDQLLLRTLLTFFHYDYKKTRIYIEKFFKQLYLEEKHDILMDDMIKEGMKRNPNKEKIDNLAKQMDEIPFSPDQSTLDNIETIDDLLDEFKNKNDGDPDGPCDVNYD